MLKDSSAPEVRLYAKTLSNLELSSNDTVRKDLQTLLQQLVQVLTHLHPQLSATRPSGVQTRHISIPAHCGKLKFVISNLSSQNKFTIS